MREKGKNRFSDFFFENLLLHCNLLLLTLLCNKNKSADVVILGELIGSDTKGRRWLSTSVAGALHNKGFKGTVIVWCDEKDSVRAATRVNNVDIIFFWKDDINGIKDYVISLGK